MRLPCKYASDTCLNMLENILLLYFTWDQCFGAYYIRFNLNQSSLNRICSIAFIPSVLTKFEEWLYVVF